MCLFPPIFKIVIKKVVKNCFIYCPPTPPYIWFHIRQFFTFHKPLYRISDFTDVSHLYFFSINFQKKLLIAKLFEYKNE